MQNLKKIISSLQFVKNFFQQGKLCLNKCIGCLKKDLTKQINIFFLLIFVITQF